MYTHFTHFFLSLIVFATTARYVFAAGIDNPIGAGSIQEFIQAVLDVVVQIGIPIAVLFVVYSGFLFVTAQGNPDKIKTAKSAFMWGIIGATVLIGANVLVDLIVGTVNQL